MNTGNFLKQEAAKQNSKAKIDVKQPNLPSGGGAIQGIGEKFQTNEFSGAANVSLPIPVTSCRSCTPQLSLEYSSGYGNSPWGLGWSINIPAITRKTSKGLPQYTTADTFLFNGDDLVPADQQTRSPKILNGILYNVLVYYSRNEGNFNLVEYWQSQDTTQQSRAFWKVTAPDHTISIFGYNDQAKITDPDNAAHIFTWLLEESYNAEGDHQLFFYKQENNDNVPEVDYEKNRIITANKYLQFVRYGRDQSVEQSLILTQDPAVNDPDQWHFEVVFDYGEYDIVPTNTNPYNPTKTWAPRPDPFSVYQATFEIRTYRRCLRTLLFHRFTEINENNPALVHVCEYHYQPDSLTQLSQLVSVREIGYQYQSSDKPYLIQPTPELIFNYSGFQPSEHTFVLVDQVNGPFLSGLEEAPNYQLADLYGEGIPGIVYADGQSVYYQPAVLTTQQDNTLLCQYEAPQICATFPVERQVQRIDVTLMDVTGDGLLDVVVGNAVLKGYYPAKTTHTWQAFQPFITFPSDYDKPHQEWVDLTGNGRSDLVQIDSDNVRVYPNMGKDGFKKSWLIPHAANFPVCLEKTEKIWTTFSDMAGSGTPSLVKIENNKIRYWPSLGYGRFDQPITMGNVPDFGKDFDTRRLFLVDIDGSGTTDLVYFYPDKAVLYLNQSGNQFSTPIIISLPVKFDNLDQVNFADIYGRGTNCLVLSIPHSQPYPTYWCYDFCQQTKPYLLNQINNNLGAKTEISYRSSVDYYLADKTAGLPWITSLPFPVHVVAQVTKTDALSATTYTNLYTYHHGYYDGVEREFRGFGRVDRQDCETINDFNTNQNAYQAPPCLTKTWYHTGCQNADLAHQYQQEYWQGDAEAHTLPPTVFKYQGTPTADDKRLSYTALQGMVLRKEVYGLDGSQWEQNPYTVHETQMEVDQLQAKGNNLYAVFLTYALQTLSYNYERNANDPLCTHHMVLAIDSYGHVLKSCEIAYGRRSIPASQPQLYNNVQQTADQQTSNRFIYAENSYVNQSDPDSYLLGVGIEEKSYETTSLMPNSGNYFAIDELINAFKNSVHSLPDSANATLLEWARHYYYDPVQQIELALGKVALPALHCRSEFVACLMNSVPSVLQPEIQNPANGYIEDTINSCYWNPGAFQAYFDQKTFYLPAYYCDPLHYQDWQQSDPDLRVATTYTYDKYYLLTCTVTDPLQNIIQFPQNKIDYQTVNPTQLIDPNNNISEVLFDPLGRVIATSHYGTEGEMIVGFKPLQDYNVQVHPTINDIVNDPAKYLQNAAAFYYYDLFAWENNRSPACGVVVTARQYTYTRNEVTATENPAIAVTYQDGFGRSLQTKTALDQPGTTVRYWDPNTQQVAEKTMDECWLTSGAVQYDNKGAVVKQYEPFFSDTYEYLDQPTLNQVGVASTLFYDALGRAVLTINAMDYLEKTLFGYLTTGTTLDVGGYLAKELYYDLPGEFHPSAWHVLSFDANDAIKQSPYYRQASSTEKSILDQLPYNTPMFSYADNLGRIVQSEQLQVVDIEKNDTYLQLDIMGNALTSADGRLFNNNIFNIQATYNLVQEVLEQISVDSGTQWSLSNVVGNPCYHQDSRAFIRRHQYDNLQRPIAITVTGGDGEIPLNHTTQQIIYGESFTNPAEWNLRGQAIVHLDQSGSTTSPFFTIAGQPLSVQKALCADYKNTPNWVSVDTQVQQQLISAIEKLSGPAQLQSIDLRSLNGLESETFVVSHDYNAVNQIIQGIDPDNNMTTPTYYINGWLSSTQIKEGPSVTSITYNARGQRSAVVYGNQVTTTYTYDTIFRLKNLHSVSNTGTVLQDYTYHYDAVNNVLSISRENISTVFFNNQQVDPSSTYTYDSLYRLKEATGREHVGMGNSFQQSLIKQSQANIIPLNQPTSNGQALQNYTEIYQYDEGGNLTQIKHSGAAANTSWTRTHTISNTSNQLAQSVLGNGSVQPVTYSYDANGNMQSIEGTAKIIWNARNNIHTAIIVPRDTGSDAEYYVYDGTGQRVRKVFEQYNSDSVSITDVIYLGDYEVRRTKTRSLSSGETTVNDDWRVIRFMDGQACAAVWRYYVKDGERGTTLDENQQRYQLQDHLNSSMLEVDTQGQIITYEEYYSFGGTALIAAESEIDVSTKYYRYSFKELDSTTGLYYYGMRYYPPWLGRWLNPDPAGTIDGLNIYVFVKDNPIKYSDVGGMITNWEIERFSELMEGFGQPPPLGQAQGGYPLITYAGEESTDGGGYANPQTGQHMRALAIAHNQGIPGADYQNRVLNLSHPGDLERLNQNGWLDQWNGVWIHQGHGNSLSKVSVKRSHQQGPMRNTSKAYDATEFNNAFSQHITNQPNFKAGVIKTCHAAGTGIAADHLSKMAIAQGFHKAKEKSNKKSDSTSIPPENSFIGGLAKLNPGKPFYGYNGVTFVSLNKDYFGSLLAMNSGIVDIFQITLHNMGQQNAELNIHDMAQIDAVFNEVADGFGWIYANQINKATLNPGVGGILQGGGDVDQGYRPGHWQRCSS